MFIISFHFWFRDLLRELNKKYEVLLIILFLVFLLFLVSEGLLFVSFFWTSFHSLSSPSLGIWPGEGFYVPDPCELTFANTLLLSNAAISLGNAFISLEISCSLLIFFSTTELLRMDHKREMHLRMMNDNERKVPDLQINYELEEI